MSCLLAIDVGNTNTVIGVFTGDHLSADWRVQTNEHRTADEYAVLLDQLMSLSGFERGSVTHVIVSSVVPPILRSLQGLCSSRHLSVPMLVVGPGVKTGMPILYENPREVGADRIVNAVAAFETYKSACIVVDFGTATTWDIVTPKGEYLGGAIAPGIRISADALWTKASKLPRVDLVRPERVVGRNTVASMQSGLYYGYVGMVDGMVERIRAEVEFTAKCVATGGLAPLIAADSRTIEETDELLTLRGLKVLFERNQ